MKRNTVFAVLVTALLFLILPGLVSAQAQTPTTPTKRGLTLNINDTSGHTRVAFAIDDFTIDIVGGKLTYDVGFLQPSINTAVTCRVAKAQVRYPAALDFIYNQVANPLDTMVTDGTELNFQRTPAGDIIGFQTARVAYCYGNGLQYRGTGVNLRVELNGADITDILQNDPYDRYLRVVESGENRGILELNTRPGFTCDGSGASSGLYLRTGDRGGSGGGLAVIQGSVKASVTTGKVSITAPGVSCRADHGGNFIASFNGNTNLTVERLAFTPGDGGGANFWQTRSNNGDLLLQRRVNGQLFPLAPAGTAVTAGYTTNGGLEDRAAGTNFPFDQRIPLVGPVVLENIPGGCPRVKFQSLNEVLAFRFDFTETCAKTTWQVAFVAERVADITGMLDPDTPLSFEGREVVLNYLPPFMIQRCTTEQRQQMLHRWLVFTAHNGECISLGAGIDIQLPRVELKQQLLPATP